MSFLELAKERYSVRKFQDREIAQSDMDKILEAANVAPTGCNYHELCKCIFGAKTVLMFTYRTDEEWHNPLEKGAHSGIQDVSIVAAYAMFEAWELGIGSCWVNYFPNSKIEEAFGLPENEKLVLLMPIGYPAEDAKPLESMHFPCKPIEDTVKYI